MAVGYTTTLILHDFQSQSEPTNAREPLAALGVNTTRPPGTVHILGELLFIYTFTLIHGGGSVGHRSAGANRHSSPIRGTTAAHSINDEQRIRARHPQSEGAVATSTSTVGIFNGELLL